MTTWQWGAQALHPWQWGGQAWYPPVAGWQFPAAPNASPAAQALQAPPGGAPPVPPVAEGAAADRYQFIRANIVRSKR